MLNVSVTDAIVRPGRTRQPHATPLNLALFDENGGALTPLSSESNQMENLPVFAGADVTALKVELNAMRTAMIDAGLMAAS